MALNNDNGSKISAMKTLLKNIDFVNSFKEFLNYDSHNSLPKDDIKITKVGKVVFVMLYFYF